jgi:trigger factor
VPTQQSTNVRVQVSEKPHCRVEMHVHADAELVREARERALKDVKKEVVLPGFRKGKAPDDMVVKKFGKEVEKQLDKAAADLAFVAAQKQMKVPLLNNNAPVSFDMKKRSEEGAEMVFSFETEPKVPNVDTGKFVERAVDRKEVGEKQVEEAVRQMRFFHAKWNPVEGRGVKDGDYILIDLSTVEGEVEQKVFQGIRFEVSSERMADWMKKLVHGAKAGQVLEGVSEPDDKASEKEREEFKPKNVKLYLLKVEEAVLPEVNDDFALKMGAANVEKMKEMILSMLKSQADEGVDSQMREQVNEFLTMSYPFDLPFSLVETEAKHRIRQMAQAPDFAKNWEKMTEGERKKFQDKILDESARAVRLFYLSRQVVQEQKISLTHQEVQDEAIALYKGQKGDEIPREVYALALSRIMLTKAQDCILKKSA